LRWAPKVAMHLQLLRFLVCEFIYYIIILMALQVKEQLYNKANTLIYTKLG